MSTLAIVLNEVNSQRIDRIARKTGRTPDDLVNSVVEQIAETAIPPTVQTEVPEWKAALMQAAGMWKDRDDIPELIEQLRREWGSIRAVGC